MTGRAKALLKLCQMTRSPHLKFTSTVSEPACPRTAPREAGTDRAALAHPLILLLILGNSFLGSSKLGAVHGSASRILLYGGTFITQLVLILSGLVWDSAARRPHARPDRRPLEDRGSLPARRGSGLRFLIVAVLLLVGLRVALGTIDLHNMRKQKMILCACSAPLLLTPILKPGSLSC